MPKEKAGKPSKKKLNPKKTLDIYSSPLPAVKIDEAILEAHKRLTTNEKSVSKADINQIAARILRHATQ